MKKILSLAVLCALCCATFAANLIPNGDFAEVKGQKPYFQKLVDAGGDAAKMTYSCTLGPENKVELNTMAQSGTLTVGYRDLKNLVPGKRHYLVVKFDVKERGAKASLAGRVTVFTPKGKYLFIPSQPILDTGDNELIYAFTAPQNLEKADLALWFAGNQQTVVKSIYIDTQLPAPNNPDGNLLRNGSFEAASLFDYAIRCKPAKTVFVERSTMKAKSGKYSLLCSAEVPNGHIEVAIGRQPCKPGTKYRYSVDFFVASATGKHSVAGRVQFFDAAGKPLGRSFPKAKVQPGSWGQLSGTFYPPADAAFVTVTIWLNGQMQTYLDNVWLGEAKDESASTQQKTSAIAATLVAGDGFTLWREAPYVKVPYSGTPKMPAAKGVELSAAANETEPFQLVLAAQKELPQVRPAFTELKGAKGVIPSSAFSFLVVDYIEMKKPKNPATRGFNADPLLAVTDATAVANRNLPFYIMVKVPAGTPAGTYTGAVKLMSKDSQLATVPLTLRVRNFALPETANLRSFFYSAPRAFAALDSRPEEVRIADFMTLMKGHRMNGNQGIVMPAPKFEIADGQLRVTDWSDFDARVNEFHTKYGMVNFRAPYFSMLGGSSGWFGGDGSAPRQSPFGDFAWLSPEGLKYAGQFGQEFTAHVKAKFPQFNFYAYLYDEPPEKVYKDLRKILTAIHTAAPDLKIFIVKQVTDEIGFVDTFIVPFAPGYVDWDRHAKAVANGKSIWYYNWRVRLDDNDYIRNRLYTWQIYAADGIGGLLWSTMHAPRGVNPWTALEKTYSEGAATIFYPPKTPGGKMSTSLRAMQIQEGIDDFDYLKILEQKIDARYPGMGKRRVKEILRTLLPTPPFDFVNDTDLLYALRNAIADEIEAMADASAAVVISSPANGTATELSDAELTILAPAGSRVAINGKAAGAVKDPKAGLVVTLPLAKIGDNPVEVKVGKKVFKRRFVRRPDPRLKELAEVISRAKAQSVDVTAAEAHLKNSAAGLYDESSRQATAKFVDDLKYAMVVEAFKAEPTFANDLSKAVFQRGKAAFNRKQFDRAEYYLTLSQKFGKFGKTSNNQVKVTAIDFQDHPAFVMDNGVVRAVILETGGRLISLKVNGVECLSPGEFKRALTLEERAARKVTPAMVTRLYGYGGYEDARGRTLMPISFVDWDADVLTLKPDQAAISFYTKLPGNSPFAIKRTFSLRANSKDLRMDYEVTNVMPAGDASEDPEHFQFDWRGRFTAAIGDGTLPQDGDVIVIPVDEEVADPLAECHFDTTNPTFYERRSIKLKEPWMGVFDPKAKTGLAMLGDSQMTHAYVWFDSKRSKKYTLEFLRSFYGNKHDDKSPNSPFEIKPGEAVGFTITIKGLTNISSQADFLSTLKK